MRFVYIIFYVFYSLLYFDYNNTHFFARFVASLTPGARSSGIIPHKDLSQKRTSNLMNGGYKVC